MTETEIEGLADHIKRVIGLHPTSRVAMIQLLEGIEQWVDGDEVIFHVLEDCEMPEMDGFTSIEHYEICLSNTTYCALERGDPEARHTAAHELGHLMLHSKRPTAYAKRADYSRLVDPEWQANYFADVFLMPAEGVRACESPEQVAMVFSVPLERARIRFQEIMKIQGELFQ